MTGGACDPNCCCDPDCPEDVVGRWKLNPTKNCAEYHRSHQIVEFADCVQESTRRTSADLQNGLMYFSKVGEVMMCAAK